MPKFRVEGVVPSEKMVSVEIAQCLLPELSNMLRHYQYDVPNMSAHATAIQAMGHQLWNCNQVLMSHPVNQDRVAQDFGIALLEAGDGWGDESPQESVEEEDLQSV